MLMDKQILDLLLTLLTQFRTESGREAHLEGAGPAASDQIAAFLDQVRHDREAPVSGLNGTRSFRVLHGSEIGLFSRDGFGLLVELSSLGLLDGGELEEIIDYARIMASEPLDRDTLLRLLPDLFGGLREGRFGSGQEFEAFGTIH